MIEEQSIGYITSEKEGEWSASAYKSWWWWDWAAPPAVVRGPMWSDDIICVRGYRKVAAI